ncbi:hypothetical protein Tco_0983043 [Tanacetum coccineum]
MLVRPTQDEGASSKRLSDEQPSPSPAPTSEVPNESLPDSFSAQPSEAPFEQQPDPSPRPSPTPIFPDSIPEPTGENLGDHSSNDTSLSGNEDDITLPNVYDLCISLCQQVSDQAKEIKLLKAKINKLKKQAKPVIKHFKAYLKTVSLQQRFPKKSSSKKHRKHKESVSKQGRKISKGESSVQRDPLFDVMPEDNIDHMETDNAQSEGRTREMVDEDKELDEDRLSIEDAVSTDKEGVSTDFERVSTDFGVLKRSLKVLKSKDQIDPKDKGKKKIEEEEESESEDDDKFPVCEENQISPELKHNRILARKLHEQERESRFTIEDLEGFDKVSFGEFDSDVQVQNEQDEFWNSQHEWKVISWKLHSSSGVHTLMTDEGLVIHMLIEKKYPLKKEIVVQMLKAKLESEEESNLVWHWN